MSRLKKPEVKAKKKSAKKPEPKKVTTADGWSPPPIADTALNTHPTHPIFQPNPQLSPGMQEILFPSKDRKILIVKTAEGGITNKEEFVKEMELLNFKVVFLEYKAFVPPPFIERHEQ